MKKVFIFGASVTYGVGATALGWSDQLKQAVNGLMYEPGGIGEVAEVYNLGIPGETTKQVAARMEQEIIPRSKSQDQLMIILSVGLNDAKAQDRPDNFINTPEGYAADMGAALAAGADITPRVIGIGYPPTDEAKVNPKQNPWGTSYFRNDRIKQFESIFGKACAEKKLQFIPVFEKAQAVGWLENTAVDGLHPNQAGHDWLFELVWPAVKDFVTS